MTRTFLYVDIPICLKHLQPGARSSYWQRPIDFTRPPWKKALSIAIKYEDLARRWPNESPPLSLPYTRHDPKAIQDILISEYGFISDDITVLMDDTHHVTPTRQNMVMAMEDLVKGARPGDHFVFHYSGHGSQVENLDNTEDDGMDEVIWPVDVLYNPPQFDDEPAVVENYIIDDDLKRILVDALPDGAHLTVLFDCCHSGTALDLPHSHSDTSLDHLWASPIMSPIDSRVAQFSLPPSRSMSLDTLSSRRRSSVNDRRNMKGVANMKLPFKARGHVISIRLPNPLGSPSTESETKTSIEQVDVKNGSGNKFKHATSWSACLDGQIGIESTDGGILTQTFMKILRDNPKRTNREVFNALSEELFNTAKAAKKYFKKEYGPTYVFPQPKPSLGSLQPLDQILDEPFTF